MSVEIAVIAGSSVAGAISAALIEKLSKTRSTIGATAGKAIQKPSTNAIKIELASLLFEKTLASEAITRVYEAAIEGKIDEIERDRLLVKYKQQLDSLNQKVSKLQPFVEYSDISELRDDLASILEERIGAIDQKLQELARGGRYNDSVLDSEVQKIIAETNTVASAASPSAEKKQFQSEEKDMEQLQNEIVKTLERLEEVELDKD